MVFITEIPAIVFGSQPFQIKQTKIIIGYNISAANIFLNIFFYCQVVQFHKTCFEAKSRLLLIYSDIKLFQKMEIQHRRFCDQFCGIS